MGYHFRCDACGSPVAAPAPQGVRSDICATCGYYPGIDPDAEGVSAKYETLTAYVRVSKELLDDADPGVDSIIAAEMGRAALRALEKRRNG